MTSPTNDHQPESPEITRGPRRLRNWTAAGLILGLVAGTGLSLTAASPFSAGASGGSDIASQDVPSDLREDHGGAPGSAGDMGAHRGDDLGHHRRAGVRGEGLRGTLLETAASFLEISADELRASLRSGSTLAEIAQEQGKSRDDLIAALVAGGIEAANEKLNEFVPRLVDGDIGPRRDS